MGIYKLISRDWEAYSIISMVLFIEEMHKPIPHIQIKKYKDREYSCLCFSSLELRMKDRDFVQKFFEITKVWEKKKNVRFIGESFKGIRKDNFSGQYKFIFSPTWLSFVLSTCGKIPNKYSFELAKKRIQNIRQQRNKKIEVDDSFSLFDKLFSSKELAAGVFLVSMDLEFRGVQTGALSLCMSESSKDFLQFMLDLARHWNWSSSVALSSVNLSYSLSKGIKASPQFELRLSIEGLKEIYDLSGPLAIKEKDKCISFHVNRSRNYINKGANLSKNDTKMKIFKHLKTGRDFTTTQLQFVAGVRVDVVLDHLHSLEKRGLVEKKRVGKGYFWNIK